MTRNVVWVDPELSLTDAAALMEEWNIRHLPVLDGNQLVGIISDRDILLRSTLQEEGDVVIDDATVGEAMTPEPFTCKTSSTLGNIAAAMVERKIDSFPVVDEEGELAGLVTSSDLLEVLIARERESKIEELPLKFKIVGGVARASPRL
jgi:acetoin utilization protein AcuB